MKQQHGEGGELSTKKTLLQEMLTFLHHANEEEYQGAAKMLHHISDLSFDEDSPTRVNERSAAAAEILPLL